MVVQVDALGYACMDYPNASSNLFFATLLWGTRKHSSFAHVTEAVSSIASGDMLARLSGKSKHLRNPKCEPRTAKITDNDARKGRSSELEVKESVQDFRYSVSDETCLGHELETKKSAQDLFLPDIGDTKSMSVTITPSPLQDSVASHNKSFGIESAPMLSYDFYSKSSVSTSPVRGLTLGRLPLSNDDTIKSSILLDDLEFILEENTKNELLGRRLERKPALKRGVLKQLICGGFAGVVSRTAVAPIDLIKTYLITSHGSLGHHKSAMTIFLEILRKEGWRGLFRGNGVNCIRVAPNKAIELYVFETIKTILHMDGHPLKSLAAPIAGGAAGIAGTFATYPLELIRTRISVHPEEYKGLVSSLMKVAKNEGIGTLYAGLTPSLVGVFPYAATNYYVYDRLRTAYKHTTGEKHVPTNFTLLFGAVAAAVSSAVTYPLEVARRQMQLPATGTLLQKHATDVVRDIYQREGFLALYRGLGTTWLKLVPAAGISFVCYEAARKTFKIEDRDVSETKDSKVNKKSLLVP